MAGKLADSSPVSVTCQKRKADWEIALEIEKECGNAYNAVAPSTVAPNVKQKVGDSNLFADRLIISFTIGFETDRFD